MNTQVKQPKAKWYIELMQRFNAVTEKVAAPEHVANEFKVLLFDVAREQYMAGNRSGIAWIRKQMSEGG